MNDNSPAHGLIQRNTVSFLTEVAFSLGMSILGVIYYFIHEGQAR